jgi:hypothetical protein
MSAHGRETVRRRCLARGAARAEAYLKRYGQAKRGESVHLGAETCTQACRSGVSAGAVEALMNNVG